MISVMNEIKSGNIYDKLNKKSTADPNCNYDIIYNEITRAKTIHMPNKLNNLIYINIRNQLGSPRVY